MCFPERSPCLPIAAVALTVTLTYGGAYAVPPRPLQVDIGHPSTASSTNDVQSGFQDFSVANRGGSAGGGSGPDIQTKTFESPLGKNGSVTVTLEAPDGKFKKLDFRDRGDVKAELGDLAEDFVFNEARLNLKFVGLKAGTYAVTTWHHDPGYAGGMIDIEVTGRPVVSGLVETKGFSDSPVAARFTFQTDGKDPVVVQMLSQSKDDKYVVCLNGFSLEAIPVVAAFDQDASTKSITQAICGVGNGAFASLNSGKDSSDIGSWWAMDHGVKLTVENVNHNDHRDRGPGGRLRRRGLADMLRDFVFFDTVASEHPKGNMRVNLEGLKPDTAYLFTWYGYENGPYATFPMFLYRDKIAKENLLFAKTNSFGNNTPPDAAANTFLATTDDRGAIRMIAGRGAAPGSNDDAKDGRTITYLNGLTIAAVDGLSKQWLADFAKKPKIAGRTARNPLGDSLTKDYSSEVELIPPTEPADALATFEVEAGFRVELVAAEPLVRDPVGMSFDERGRLFVAEMRGYNQGNRVPCSDARKLALETKKLGCVKLLEDTDGDGCFDKSSLYVDDLIWPNGVFAYDGGVFVAAAPDVFYCKDTNGDGRADIRELVFTGFGYSNWQHLPNSFRWGLDNRIHGASGSGGGEIRCPVHPDAKPVQIRGRDFAFDPRTLRLAPTNSSAQFGLSFDDWGNKFLCSNSSHILQVFFEDRYIVRNPYLVAPRSWRLIAAAGSLAPVFRISPPEPHRVVWMRMRTSGVIKGIVEKGGAATGYITAAGGTTIYRGDAWPAKYRNTSFTPECSSNVIHRNVLEPAGIEMVARRVDKNREFLASRDIWFRPVNMIHGPGGNLYMADMYRQVINEGVVLPPTLRKCFDLTEGCNRGRIYRVVPEGFKQPEIPDLGKATTAELVALLEHPNAWHHVTAARLLYQRQDRAAVEPLKKMAAGSSSALGRMHAMYALDGLSALSADVVLARLADRHAGVRRHAVRLSERVLVESPAVQEKLLAMVADDDLRVRYQLAFTLGDVPGEKATAALAAIAARDGGNRWVRLAVLSSSLGRAGDLFSRLAAEAAWRKTDTGRAFLESIAEQVGLQKDRKQVTKMLEALETFTGDEKRLSHAVVRGLSGGLEKSGGALRDHLASVKGSRARRVLAEMVEQSVALATDVEKSVERRLEAIRSLALAPFEEVGDVFPELLESRQPQAIQMAAFEALNRCQDVEVADMIVEAWPGFTPQVRGAAAEALFSRRERLSVLLAAIEDEVILTSQLDPARIKFLLAHPDKTIRKKAAELLADVKLARREEAVTAYQDVLTMKGDLARGKAVFKRECATCHRLEGVGYDLGLPLGAIKERGPDGILLNVLDPNRDLNPQYTNYVLVTDDGRSITGMIAAETANSITLTRAEGESDTVLRANIEELQNTGTSIMPEGLEKQISKREMADLIAYLMSLK